MSESKSAYPYDESFWEHKRHTPDIVVRLAKDKKFYILNALEDTYQQIDRDPADAKHMITLIAGAFMASAADNLDMFMEEVEIQENVHRLDAEIEHFFKEMENE